MRFEMLPRRFYSKSNLLVLRVFLVCAVLLFVGSSIAQAQPSTTRDSVTQLPQMDAAAAKVVEVSRVFDPWISDAGKINFLPQLDDTVVPVPKFEYHLMARPLLRLLPLRPIPPAKMGHERPTKLSPFYVKIGGGNNLSPWAEAYVSGGRSEKLTYSLAAQHLSSWGSLEVGEEGKLHEVEAPYAKTRLDAQLRGFSAKRKLSYYVAGDYRHDYSSFYGVGDTLVRALDTLWKKKYSRHLGGIHFEVGSAHLDTTHFQYLVRGNVSGYADNYHASEWHTGVAAEGYKNFDGQRYGAKLSLRHYGLSLGEKAVAREYQNTLFSLAPWVKIYGERWRALAGVDITYDNNDIQTGVHVYPRGHISYDIIRQFFIPYLEIDGGTEVANRATLSIREPYLSPYEKVWNTSRNLEIRLGARGKFTDDFSFHFYGGYAIIDSMRFVVNAVANREVRPLHYEAGLVAPLHSVYDRAAETHLMGELHYALSSRFAAGVRADYWSYSLVTLLTPWHAPSLATSLYANYNLRDKIYIGIDFNLLAGRKAQLADGTPKSLPATLDFNIQGRYRVGRRTSLFIDLQNLLFQREYTYYLYPRHRLQVYAGIILEL